MDIDTKAHIQELQLVKRDIPTGTSLYAHPTERRIIVDCDPPAPLEACYMEMAVMERDGEFCTIFAYYLKGEFKDSVITMQESREEAEQYLLKECQVLYDRVVNLDFTLGALYNAKSTGLDA